MNATKPGGVKAKATRLALSESPLPYLFERERHHTAAPQEPSGGVGGTNKGGSILSARTSASNVRPDRRAAGR